MKFYIAQIVGALAAVVVISTIQFKHKKNIILGLTLGNLLFALSFLLLDAYTGAIVCFIGGIQTFISYLYNAKDKKFPKVLIPIYILIGLGCGVVTYRTYIDILAIICSVIYTITITQTKERTIRLLTFTELVLWVIYNAIVGAYSNMMAEAFFLISTTIAIVRYDIFKKSLKNNELDMLKKIEDFNINCNKNFLLEDVVELKNGRMIYSNIIEDYYWNYIIGINAKDKEEFKKVWEENRQYMIEKNRQPVFYITPSSNILNNYEKILPEYMKIQSKEVWMTFEDFNNLKPFEENKNIDIQIERNADLKEFADTFMKSYSSDGEEDPYGQLPENYRQVILNYDEEKNKEYVKNFYIAKHNNQGVGITMSLVKGDMALISSVGTIKEYRNKGICTTLMNRVLNDLKKENVKLVFLQTEEGFAPEKLYKKMGFKTVCKALIAVEK